MTAYPNDMPFRAIFDTMFQFIGLMRPDGTLIEANQTALDFGGITRADVIGKPFWECHWWTISLETQATVKAAIQQAARGEFIRYEVDVLGAAGRVATIDFSIKPVCADSGEVLFLIPEGRDITAQKQATTLLQDAYESAQLARDRLRGIIDGTTDLIAAIDLELRFITFNKGYAAEFQRIFGTRIQEGMHVLEALTHQPEEQIIARNTWERALRGEEFTATRNFYLEHGQQVFYEITYSSIYDQHGKRIGATHVIRNITGRKQAEQALRESEALLSSVLTSALDGIAVLRSRRNDDGDIVDFEWLLVNPRAEELLIRPAHTFIGKGLIETLPEQVTYGLFAAYKQVVETGRPYQHTILYNANAISNTRRWFHYTAVKVGDGLAVTFRDMTEQKEAEEMRLAMAAAQMGTWELDLTTSVLTLAGNTDHLPGYPHNGRQHMPVDYVNSIHPDDRDRVETAITTSITSRTESYVEYRIQRSDGTTAWIASRGNVMPGEHGQPVRLIGVTTDITERKHAEEVQARLNATLESLLANAPVGFAFFDRQHRYLRINETLARINGLPVDAHLGRTIAEVLPVNARSVDPLIDQIFTTGQAVQNLEIIGETPAAPGITRHWLTGFYPVMAGKDVISVGAVVIEISEQKQVAEELQRTNTALEQSLAQLEAIVQSIDQGLIVADTTGNILDMNPVALRLHEYTSVEEVRQQLQDFADIFELSTLDGDPIPLEAWPLARALAGDIFSDLELRVHRKDTGTTWIGAYGGTLVRDKHGNVVLVVLTLKDITDRKRNEQALRESEARFRGTFDNATMGIAHVGFAGEWLRVNQRLCTIVGYDRDELLQLTFQDITHPDDIEADMHLFRQLMRGSLPSYQMEKRYLHKDGHVVWINLTTALQRDEQDNPLYCISIVEDITKRKAAEAALHESQERLRAAITASGTGTFRWDIQTGTMLWDESLNQLFGLPAGATATHFDAFLHLIHPDDRTVVAEAFQHSIAVAEDLHQEFRVICPDDSIRWMAARGKAFEDESGRWMHMIGACMDITAHKQSEAALREARDAAEVANQMKSVFLANMSHEIRTPLTTMIGYASLLANKLEGKPRTQAQRIEQGGKRLLETLNAVLTLARLEADRIEVEQEPLRIATEVQEVVKLYTPQAEAKNLTLNLYVQEQAEGAHARLDRGALNSILQNLISNAIKYTEQGYITITIDVNASAPDGATSSLLTGRAWVHIHVEDTGIGIDPAFMPYLFDPFRQESVGMGRSYDGSGLGLSIARQLIEKMHGSITVQSTKGRGSRFTVSFLRLDSEPAPTATIPHARVQHGQPRCQVLLVEDNTDTRMLIAELLEEWCELTAVSNAQAATIAARHAIDTGQPRFDAVLVDINLGNGPSGTDFLTMLRAMPAYQTVPVAAITAYALPGDRERFLQHGFNAYLRKPFTTDELQQLMIELLPHRRLTFEI